MAVWIQALAILACLVSKSKPLAKRNVCQPAHVQLRVLASGDCSPPPDREKAIANAAANLSGCMAQVRCNSNQTGQRLLMLPACAERCPYQVLRVLCTRQGGVGSRIQQSFVGLPIVWRLQAAARLSHRHFRRTSCCAAARSATHAGMLHSLAMVFGRTAIVTTALPKPSTRLTTSCATSLAAPTRLQRATTTTLQPTSQCAPAVQTSTTLWSTTTMLTCPRHVPVLCCHPALAHHDAS